MKKILYICLSIFFIGCSDNANVVKYDKDVKTLKCLRLSVFPPNKDITDTLKKLYKFDENCNYKLEVSKKGGIVCNSNQNAQQKALSNFPSGFIRLDIYQDRKIIYSYYKDLTNKVKKSDIENAFLRLKNDFNL